MVILAAALGALALVVTVVHRSLPAVASHTARALYVSPAGSDDARGTQARPFRTLAHALRVVRPGSTVFLRAGTYPGWATAARDGTQGDPIVITAYPGERPTITGRLTVAGAWTTVSGLRFVGGTPADAHGVLLYLSGADHASILRNELEHAAMSAMYVGDVGDGSDYVTIAGNHIHDNGTHHNLDHGIYFGTGAHGKIVDNVITGNLARGIQCYPGCTDTLIANNTVLRNGGAGIQVGSDDESTSSGDTIAYNVVAENGDAGIRSYWGGRVGAGVVARRNLVWHNRGENTAGPGIRFVGTIVANPSVAKSVGLGAR